MSEPNRTAVTSSAQHGQTEEPPNDVPIASSAPTLAHSRPAQAGSGRRLSLRGRSVIIAAAVVAVIATGVFAAHQVRTYGALVPSIAGEWYGPFWAAQGGTGHYVNSYNIYVRFIPGNGNQLSATTSSCSAAGNAPYTQPPIAGFTLTGAINGAHFTMAPPGGDIESDLSWDGIYSPDKVRINFYVNSTARPGAPYADLQRGTHADFLRTCRVQ